LPVSVSYDFDNYLPFYKSDELMQIFEKTGMLKEYFEIIPAVPT
jgi:hypothetical protein